MDVHQLIIVPPPSLGNTKVPNVKLGGRDEKLGPEK